MEPDAALLAETGSRKYPLGVIRVDIAMSALSSAIHNTGH